MKRFKKVMAVGMSVALTVGSLSLTGFNANAAGLPTTEGHNKYVNSDIFNVIGSDTFGTAELETPLFDKTQGSHDISNLQIPVLAYDESSIGFVWEKPEKYDDVADYNVYINGVKAGTARQNFKENAKWTAKYMEAFYEYYDTASDVDMVDVDIHSYRATGLEADTEYTFKVVAVDKDGKELGTAKTITGKTTAKADVFNIVDFGAVATEGYTSYDDEKNAIIEKNTKAIQDAIDACTPGGKVVIPEAEDGKVFVSGAVWLKSDMTLEVNGTLWASPNSDHFEIGFLMYPFYTDTRGWGLVNAMSADESAPVTNVRVTGTGTLYGNGWKYGAADKMYGNGYESNVGKNTQAGDPDVAETDSEYGLPRYMSGSNTKVYWYGVQAADSAKKYLANLKKEDGSRKYSDELINKLAEYIAKDLNDNGKINYNGKDAIYADSSKKENLVEKVDLTNAYATRSSLLIMRNCENVYVGDITIENPSNHSVNILDSRNIATENVKVFSFDGNNGDGLGFGCSQNVICWNNFTDTGDDNLGFGASVGEGARDCDIQTNSEIWMFNNFLREGHGGLAAGSHTGNGIQDVLFEDTVMNHIDMAFRFKSAPTNGGFGANITMRDCAVADTNQGWVMTTSYSDPNSASSTEAAEVGEFYNFASYNVSLYGLVQNTIQVLADVDPVGAPNKPWHTHHNLYFQDITFGNVGGNGKYKNKNGWETLIGCENAVFYNVKTVSYNKKAIGNKTDKAWNNLQYCKDIVFQGTTWESVNACTDKMKNAMSGIIVKDSTVTAKEYVEEVVTPGEPSEPGQESAWAKKASEATDFFNDLTAIDSGAKVPKYEHDEAKGKDNIGYIWDNTSNQGNTSYPDKMIGYAYKKCDIKDLSKLSLSFARGGTSGTGKVSIRLDRKDGAEIASAVFDATDKDYHDYVMDVNLPEGTDTSVNHDLYLVFSSTNTSAGQKYIGNAKTLTATKSASKEEASVDVGGSTESADAKQAKVTWNAVDNGNESSVFYGIDTYVGDQKVDMIDGLTGTEALISRLSAGVEYTFKVYVSEIGDSANSMKTTGWNKTYIGEAKLKIEGSGNAAIVAPEKVEATTGTTIYTHTQATWTNVAKSDERVRGYKFYVNGELKKTVYNYEIAKYETVDTVSKQVGRLTPGMVNEIKIVAFTDAGLTYEITTTAETLKNYDYKAPVFGADAALTAKAQENGDVVLTWTAATDDTKVGGYRVYVDGSPVVPEGQDEFNPVNGAKTTTETTYTVTGLDLTKDHTFTVQAGDTWWKAETVMGTFDKMAGFNWTVKGISTELKVEEVADADYTALDAAIAKAEALDASEYVDFTKVAAAVKEAKELSRTLTANEQSQVDEKTKAIEDAVNALEKKQTQPDKGDKTEPTVPDDGGASTDADTSETAGDTTATGDSSMAMVYAFAAMLSMLVLAGIYADKKRKA